MTNNRLVLFVVCVILSTWSCFPKPEKNKCRFSEKPALDWSDFHGTGPTTEEEKEFDAVLTYGIEYEYWYRSVDNYLVLDMTAYSYFDRSSSWKGEDVVDTDYDLLQHEETHLLIAELHARIFKKSLDEYTFTLNYEKEIERQFNSIYDRMNEMQTQYDEETDHSTITDEQERWEFMIHDSLLTLYDYRKEKYTIETSLHITQEELNVLSGSY